MSQSYETILVDVQDGVAVVTLNRPKVLNALNAAMIGELTAAFRALDADSSVRAAILTGSGERAFAAGADISELNALPSAVAGVRTARRGQELTVTLETLRFPVIAAVNGFALGGGCEIAMACDIRIAADTAKFGQPEVNLGIPPGFGGTQRMARLVGRGMALLLCSTGEMIDANEALRIGLVERVVPAAELLDAARKIATTIASKAPLAIEAVKRAIDEGVGLDLPRGLALEALQFGAAVNTADFREGTSAFLEKRQATFSGS